MISHKKLIYFICLLLLAFKGTCLAKPFALITVDVETISFDGQDLSLGDQWDLEENGTQYGFSAILDILEKHNMRGVFFYNAYEYETNKDEKIIKIAKMIENRGHDIELHTHPQWAYNREKVFMHQYSLDEQTEIVRHGKNLLESWTGKTILAHRAGAYGADKNTLTALENNDIFWDSSFFFQHKWCKLNAVPPLIKKNYLTKIGKILEVPVNVFQLDSVPFFMNDIPPIKLITKYDINKWVSEQILVEATDTAIRDNFDTIVYFLHSFSFIKKSPTTGSLSPELDLITKFNNILNYITEKQLEVVTFKELNSKKMSDTLLIQDSTDKLPIITVKINPLKYIIKRLNISRKDLTAFLPVLGIIAMLSLMLFLVNKRRQN